MAVVFIERAVELRDGRGVGGHGIRPRPSAVTLYSASHYKRLIWISTARSLLAFCNRSQLRAYRPRGPFFFSVSFWGEVAVAATVPWTPQDARAVLLLTLLVLR